MSKEQHYNNLRRLMEEGKIELPKPDAEMVQQITRCDYGHFAVDKTIAIPRKYGTRIEVHGAIDVQAVEVED